MKSKFKNTEHTSGTWKVRKSTDFISVKSGKIEIGSFTERHSPDNDLKTSVANAAICSAGPEMLSFIKEFVKSIEAPIEKRKSIQAQLYKDAFSIIEKAQDTEIPLKTYYYFISQPPRDLGNNIIHISEPTFLMDHQAFDPRYHKLRKIKKIEARNKKEAKEKIFETKKHIAVKLTDKRPNHDQD